MNEMLTQNVMARISLKSTTGTFIAQWEENRKRFPVFLLILIHKRRFLFTHKHKPLTANHNYTHAPHPEPPK